jgi:RHS repeat-associated protein
MAAARRGAAILAVTLLVPCAFAVTLTVQRAGSGFGTVSGNGGAIDCGAVCGGDFAAGTQITLAAAPAAGSQFTGWLGTCTGTSACTFTIEANETATATFAPLSIGIPTLDIDGNGSYGATDGLLVLRHLFGLSGSALIEHAIGFGALRASELPIETYLEDIRPILDVDGNGEVDALTDGVLILRYLFGLRDTSLVGGAIGAGAIRTDADTIEALLALLTPVVPPPDPATVASPNDPTVATSLFAASAFLYAGPNPIQTGVAPDTIEARRVAVLRGKVENRDGTPLTGATITILGHPEFGQTVSRADGMFDLAVNGGGVLTVDYRKDGYIAAQRPISAPWRDYAWLPDVVLIAYDTAVTTIDLAAPGMKTARGNPVSDLDGTRRATILFPAGTTATMKLPGGGSQPLASLAVRATEYTIGPTGPKAMPAPLPPSSGYTYAVELSIDQAIAAGATEVAFNQPLPFYVENFLGFPVGGAVPTGFYDRQQGQWVASANGRVIKILSITGGVANLDIDGDALADDAPSLAAIGITADERMRLAQLYVAGQSLWRMRVAHFSPWDGNWPYGPPPDAVPPEDGGDKDKQPDKDCKRGGSIIACESQSLGQSLPVTGTPFRLHYESSRAPGRKDAHTISFPVIGASVPASLQAIRVEVTVAGRMYAQTFGASPNQTFTMTWDGKDAYNRIMRGAQPANVQVFFDYGAQYYAVAADFENSFAKSEAAGAAVAANRAAGLVAISKKWIQTVGVWDARIAGLDGWTLNVHHAYDPGARTLEFGDGNRRSAEAITGIITTLAGNGVIGTGGDGGAATAASLAAPHALAVGPDGSVFIVDAANQRVRRVTPDGVIHPFAGTGVPGYNGDGIPATSAQLFQPEGIALGPDGSVYIADGGNNRIRRVKPDGFISTVAGTGVQGSDGDGGPATAARLWFPFGVALGPDGSLIVADTGNSRIRRVGPDGVITTVAGNPDADVLGDGGPATAAMLTFPRSVALGADGSVYIADAFDYRVRRVRPDGIIVTFAGTGNAGSDGDGGVATLANLTATGVAVGRDGSVFIVDSDSSKVRRVGANGIITTWAGNGSAGFGGDDGLAAAALLQEPAGVAVAPDGSVVIADNGNYRVRRVGLALPGFASSDLPLPSADGSELYVFNAAGRHASTFDALTGAVRYQFGYDGNGYLVTITDGAGNATSVARSGESATSIVAPGGQQTTLSANGNGWLAGFARPGGASYAMAYSADGLMQSFTDPRNKTHTMIYDAAGRLKEDHDPAGGSTMLVRDEQANGYIVTATTALGRVTTYQYERLPTGVRRRTVTAPGGAQTIAEMASDGTDVTTFPAGNTRTVTYAPDPRFGMLAPFVSNVVFVTPNGLTRTVTTSRSATLANPGNLLSLTNFTESFTDNGNVTSRVYANNGATRTLTWTTAAGRTTTAELDALGRLTKKTIAGLAPVSYAYDSHGLLASVTHGTTGNSRSVGFAYNAKRELTTLTDPLGRATTLAYDSAGRVTTQTLPGARVFQYAWDAAGNPTSITPPGRPAHTFAFDAIDQSTGYTPPDVGGGSTTTQLTLDNDHALGVRARPDGKSVTFGYDGTSGKPASMSIARGTFNYSYDPTGHRLAGITAPGGIGLSYTYDGNLLTGIARSGAIVGATAYVFDDDLRISEETVNGANAASFAYDGDGLLVGAGAMTLLRNAQNGLLTGTALGAVTDSLTRDTFGAVTGYGASYNGSPVYQVAYTYDALRRVTQKVETIGGTSTTHGYSYDAAGRLSAVTQDGAAYSSYGYDGNGNRTSRTGPGGPLSASYDAQDRVASYGTVTYVHTANGERSSKTESGLTTSYDYDELGNLMKATLPGGPVIDYVVDGRTRRIGKKVNGTLVQGFLYQGQLRPVAELDGANAVISRFVYAGKANVPGYMIKGGATYRIVTDQAGSPRVVVNVATGSVAQRIDYDEFGQVLSDTNPGFQPFGYAGGLYDTHTKLVRFGARDYDARTGRWTAKDPIGFAGGDANLYAYVANNPQRYVDPNGLAIGDWWDVPANLFKTADIGDQMLAKYDGHHNDLGDAKRHSEWMKRTTEETNICIAILVGTGHEITGLLQGQPVNEAIMDLYNNSVGQAAAVTGESIDPADLATSPTDAGDRVQSNAQSVLQSVLSYALSGFF